MNDSDTTQPVDRPVNMSDFAHLFWMAGVLAFASVFLYVAIKVSQDTAPVVLFGCMLSGSALATAFVGSVWAVFGPGSYLKRLFWSHLFIGVVGLGHLAGFTLMAWGDIGFDFFYEPIQFLLFGVPVVSFAAQIPLWFFRFFFGWQFTFGSSPPVESFSLRDIFVFTFLAAIGFAGTQMAANQVIEQERPEGLHSVAELDGPVTDRKLVAEKRLEFEREIRFEVLFGYATVGMWSFGISLLSLPVVFFMLRSKEFVTGCLLTVAYTFICFVLLALTIGFPEEFIMNIGIYVVFYAVLVSIAFTASREEGFQLTSPRWFSREATAGSEKPVAS